MMTATECPSKEQLRELTLGNLSLADSDDLVDHLKHCVQCQTDLETLDSAEDSLITGLRAREGDDPLDREPECSLAVAKALGALAMARQNHDGESALDFPEAIGEYEIVHPLGRGGMGNVFLARHTKLGREVALKVIADHRLADRRVRERFENEMRAIGRLSHPNIVTAHDAREIDGTAVLVTEYIDGLDLRQVVDRVGPLSLADACEIVKQVAVALQYSSDQGFVHRDIKPSNIMLNRSGQIKVLDLGLARLQSDDQENSEMTGTGQTMGTADYISPEQVTDSRNVDIRADIYSLGCTLFQLLTGHAPFSSDAYVTAFAKMNAHVSEPPPSLRDAVEECPAKLALLVDSMLAKSPADRPQKPIELANSLSAFCDGADLTALINTAVESERGNGDRLKSARQFAATTTSPPGVLPWWRRPVKTWTAIAAGFGGIVLGVLMGIWITVEYDDGRIAKLWFDGEPKVSVQQSQNNKQTVGEGKAKPAGLTKDAPEAKSDLAKPIPVMFGVLMDGTDVSVESSDIERINIATSDGGSVAILRTDRGDWFPVLDDVSVGTTIKHAGQNYALVSRSPDDLMTWEELSGHVLAVQTTGFGQMEMRLDPQAAAKLQRLTKRNLRKRMAMIVDGQIVSAPSILSELSNAVSVQAKFTHEQSQMLINAFHSASPEKPSNQVSVDAMKAALRGSRMNPPSRPQGNLPPNLGGTVSPDLVKAVWSIREIAPSSGDSPPSPETIIFDGEKFSMWNASGCVSWGKYRIKKMDQWSELDLIDEEREQTMFGIIKKNPLSQLELRINGSPKERPENFLSGLLQAPSDMHLYLNLVSPLPENQSQINALAARAGGSDQVMAKQARTILRYLIEFGSQIDSPAVQNARVTLAGDTVVSNLKQIGLAFHNFHAAYNAFPPSAGTLLGARRVGNKPVQPFSWRVAILPFIEHAKLFEQYRFDEPWDSENNSKLLEKMPDVFRSPQFKGKDPVGHTHFQGYATKEGALGDDKPIRFADMRDGTSNTLLLIETADSVPWTKPQDIRGKASLTEKGPYHLLMADGSVRSEWELNPEALKKWITRAGRETITEQ